MSYKLHEELDFSKARRAFAVGDIHGEYRKLDQALLDVGFQPEEGDVLVSVGDLVDRGPYSEEFEKYIAYPWFYRAKGNHEDQPQEFLLGYETTESVSNNCGDWFLAKSVVEQHRLAQILRAAPLALTITTPGGRRVGIAHADCHDDWNRLIEQCSNLKLERFLTDFLTASRETIRMVQGEPTLHPKSFRVQNIDHVFHGHTPLDHPLTVANRSWIDTGACDCRELTLVDMDVWITNHPS